MACVIRLSEPLLKLRSRKDLVETLLHEMIHAWNFIRGIMEENGGHGQNFLAKMHEINRAAGTNISVYHSFHDEVDLYKKHWWKCNGPCQNRTPHLGVVKRTCNRAPGPNDFWWKQHEQSCGGQFIKVKEPERVEKKRNGKENKGKVLGSETKKPQVTPKGPQKTPKTKISPGADIRKFFKPSSDDKPATSSPPSSVLPTSTAPGGQTLGGPGSGRSRLLDMFAVDEKAPKKRKLAKDEPSTSSDVIVIDDDFAPPRDHKSFHDSILQDFDDDDIILIDDEFDDTFTPTFKEFETKPEIAVPAADGLCHCPVCNIKINITEVNEHLDMCLGN